MLSLFLEEKKLDTGGQSNELEQLGHDNRSGSQPLYLQGVIYLDMICSVKADKYNA